MGYSAKGSGSATIKRDCVSELRKTLETAAKDPKSYFMGSFDWDIMKISDNNEEKDIFDFNEYDDHWHEEDTYAFLNLLTPYITDGCICYDGEDGCLWRYKFLPEENNWDEEAGEVIYKSDFKSYKFVEIEGEGSYKTSQINKHIDAMGDDFYYMPQLAGVLADPISLDKNALKILKAYYSGRKLYIRKED